MKLKKLDRENGTHPYRSLDPSMKIDNTVVDRDPPLEHGAITGDFCKLKNCYKSLKDHSNIHPTTTVEHTYIFKTPKFS